MSLVADDDVVSVVGDTIMFRCPGCEDVHAVRKGLWTWNDDRVRPTFHPSVLVNRGGLNPTRPICHSFVTAGEIRFLGDCTHELAGKVSALPPWNNRA